MPRLSIKTKLIAAISVFVLGFVLFHAVYAPRRLERQIRHHAEQSARQVVDALGHALVPAMASGNRQDVDTILTGLQGMPSYAFCAVFDDRGVKISASSETPEWVSSQRVKPGIYECVLKGRKDKALIAAAPVYYRQPYHDKEGLVIIGFSGLETRRAMEANVRLGLWMGLSALVLGLAITAYFSKRYVKPLLQLSEATKQVTQGNLDWEPIDVSTNDEVEDLIRNFGDMTGKLRVSREEISRQNRLLEFRVQERTRQLMETIWELEEIRSNLEGLVQERTRGLEQSQAELKAWANTLEEKVREKTLELTELNHSLMESFQKLQQVDQMKDEFLANMSHELRTPLNAVIGFSGLLLQESDERIPEDVKEDLKIILQNGHSLLSLIDSILDLSKIEAGKFELEDQEMDPMPILESLRSLATALILNRPIRFRMELPPWGVRIYGDPQRFKQVLTNLVGNAVKFTERGEVSIAVAREGGKLRISIGDTGIGMSPEDIKRLFKPFQQVDGSITRRFGGTGLGLALSQRLMGLMRGRISVESEKGAGSIFTLEMPIVREVAP